MSELCANHDPDLWFPERRNTTAQAIAICNRCPMIDACRQHALDKHIRYGIWGGQTEAERDKILYPRKNKSKKGKKKHPRTEEASDVRGVSWNATKGRWVVVIRHGGAMHWVGQFVAREAAEAAAIIKCEELGTGIVRSRSGKKAA